MLKVLGGISIYKCVVSCGGSASLSAVPLPQTIKLSTTKTTFSKIWIRGSLKADFRIHQR